MVEQVAIGVEYHDFTAGAEARINAEDAFFAQRGSEQQLAGTVELLEDLLERLQQDPSWREGLQQLGQERIGSGGGGARMAADLDQLLQEHRHG